MSNTFSQGFHALMKYGRVAVFLIAPVISIFIILYADLDPENPAVTYTLAVAILMALWWVTEVVPLAITSLIPIILFPVFGIMDGKDVSATYFNHVIFLLFGGFLMALAIQKWNLHRRIALHILRIIGQSPGSLGKDAEVGDVLGCTAEAARKLLSRDRRNLLELRDKV